jgi:hypothetical protein
MRTLVVVFLPKAVEDQLLGGECGTRGPNRAGPAREFPVDRTLHGTERWFAVSMRP